MWPRAALAPVGQAGSGDQLRKWSISEGTGERKALRWGVGRGSTLGEEALGAGGRREAGPEAQA